MLTITVLGGEFFNEEKQEFVTIEDVVLELEHSLVSLSKWESKFRKPFLGPKEKTTEEVFGYIEAMVTSPNFSPEVLGRLSNSNLSDIQEYISSTESATTFGEGPPSRNKPKQEIITSELIYYWMVSYTIPFECETWHLSRLFSLIQICNIKNSKPTKMSKSEIASRNRALNAQRKAKLGTSG